MKTRKRNMRNKVRKKRSRKTRKNSSHSVYKGHDYNSGEGMLTSVWGPTLWHYLHTMSFNYPVKPTPQQKKDYMGFIKSLVNVLPCKYCRINLVKNFKDVPLNIADMKDRNTFSRYVYRLHEHINKMLGKKSNLTYNEVRDRYEHFRSRCTLTDEEVKKLILKREKHKHKTQKRKGGKNENEKEKGCTTPLYGKKSKCILKIIPQDTKCETFQIDKKCIKKNIHL